MSNLFCLTYIIASLSNLTCVDHKTLISQDKEWQCYLNIEEFEQSQLGNWTMTNSFRAAYITWDEHNRVGAYPQENQFEREFDYDEFPFEEFYNLSLESSQNFQTANIQHETTIGIELNKNIFGRTSRQSSQGKFDSLGLNSLIIPNPYVAEDFFSKKNYLGLYIEHEAALGDRLFLSFEGTFDVAIPDTIDFESTSLIDPIENNNFFPEISLEYQLTHSLLAYTSFEYGVESIEGKDFRNQRLRSETYQTWEVGIKTQLNDNWLATVSFEREIQNNFTTTDPNEPDFDLQINRQIGNSWTGEISGELNPGWWLYGFYTYTDATVTEDEVIKVGNSLAGIARHTGGLWTSYEITQGQWQGLGLGSGIIWNGERPADAVNSSDFPDYLQFDLAIFYNQDHFKAAISVQNLFNGGFDEQEVTSQTILGTILWKF
ncbi:outer membrane receptor protein [Xenococcus sp. PCC 7305]|uniref:TonB-dependent siderophore receptor n=1 Tax=Xenococcus sp. PCC 7305 TaxID=102125 RepID=UPI0002AC2B7A|nr:TonB-dependent receptor [Xenococcus sp. PCC 7305]ELS00509.1 outer membrane receptor protein [Xenococcus sp. PCC 7305]